MKRWLRLTLVCCALLYLCLSLPLAVGLNHSLQMVGLRPEFDRRTEPASDARVSLVRSMSFDPACTGPLASLVLDCSWTAGNLGPPSWATHGPPETDRTLASRWSCGQSATPTNALDHTLLLEITGSNRNFEVSRF